MRKHATTIVLIVILAVGLGVLLYPSISNYVNQIDATHAIGNYDEAISGLSDEEKAELLEQAATYNEGLAESSDQSFNDGEPQDEEYASLLNVNGDGMMGYVTIHKLGVQLPIYHGTSDEVLVSGAGHLEGSSLPIGGESTHAVITGHRGLPSAKLFTDLDQLEVGDTFTVTVLDQTLTYEVDQISIVEPDDTSKLLIDPSEDEVTLLTCTPYAVNTQRLLVRGKRTSGDSLVNVPADAMVIDPTIVAPILAAPILIVLLILLFTGHGRGRKTRAQGTHAVDGRRPGARREA